MDKGKPNIVVIGNTTARNAIGVPQASLTACSNNIGLACLTVTKTVSDPNNVASGLLSTLRFRVVVTDANTQLADTFLHNGESIQIPIAVGDQFSVTEVNTASTFAFTTTTTGTCSGTASSNSPITCNILNTLSGTGTAITQTPFGSLTPPLSQVTNPPFAILQGSIPPIGTANPLSTKNCPSGLPCGSWQIFESGLVGQLNISSLDDKGKVNGTVFGHQIINGSWDQVAKKFSFTEKIAVPYSNSTDYKYDGFLHVFCDPSAITKTFPISTCTGVLAGSLKPITHEPLGNKESGWLAISSFPLSTV